MRAATLVFALALFSYPALGDTTLPVVDVDSLCAKMGKNANWCGHSEQELYTALKSFEWKELSEGGRNLCLRAVGSPRPRYYFLLEGCVIQVLDNERITRQEHEPTKFKP